MTRITNVQALNFTSAASDVVQRAKIGVQRARHFAGGRAAKTEMASQAYRKRPQRDT